MTIHILPIRQLLVDIDRKLISLEKVLENEESCVRKLVSEFRSVKKIVESTFVENSVGFKEKYEDHILVLDYIIFLHLSFFLICSENFVSLRGHRKIEPGGKPRMAYISLMLSHLANSLLSIRTLLERGLDTQAKQILRSYVEYSDISIAILGNNEFYNQYKLMGEDESLDKQIWYKFVRPAALTKILKPIYSNLPEEQNVWELIKDIRTAIYSNLSDYAHGHMSAVFTSAFTEEEGINVLGKITREINNTLVNSISYSYFFLRYSMMLVVQHQNIPFREFGKDGVEYIRHYKILEQIMPEFLSKYADKT